MKLVLEAQSLAKTYREGGVDVLALRGVDFAVESGEFVAVTGPSGCGKSTLLNLLGGLDRPTAGQVKLNGQRFDSLTERQRAIHRRRHVGFVFQFFNLLGTLTAAENAELPALLAGLGVKYAESRREELFALLEIEEVADKVPSQLSGGEQQRVALARALVNRPSVILADEPTGNLDSVHARDVVGLLRSLREEGQAILLVTHDPRVAAAADRVIMLRDGLVVGTTKLDAGRGAGQVLAGFLDLEA